eukprot:SAG22_NODE_415_length_10814_cov_10.762109_7_plen_320_part_00
MHACTINSTMRSAAAAVRPQLYAQVGRRSFAKAGLACPNIGIAGATGAVGKEIMSCIEKRGFPFADLTMWAHPDEAGDTIEFMGKTYTIEAMGDDSFDDVDIALFSAGGSISEVYAPKAAAAGCVVVDNSSEFRMNPDCPLVVPEVNGHAVATHKGIIANPNCTTILMNVPVHPLHKVRMCLQLWLCPDNCARHAAAPLVLPAVACASAPPRPAPPRPLHATLPVCQGRARPGPCTGEQSMRPAVSAAFLFWQAFGVTRVVASTYQAASGAGLDAMKELEQQAKDWVAGACYCIGSGLNTWRTHTGASRVLHCCPSAVR